MLVVKVELHSAITGKITEIARSVIWNTGKGTSERGEYNCVTLRDNGDGTDFDKQMKRALREGEGAAITKRGAVSDYPRKNIHVFNLVARALADMGFK